MACLRRGREAEPLSRGGAVSLLAELGHRPRRATEDVRARRPTATEGTLLDLTSGEWVLSLTRRLTTDAGVPVEVSMMAMVAEGRRLQYQVAIE
ncbi:MULTISPECIES: UTRA domain-containing protein [unclassified Micromonospora]|uniref:UTRA domain-containing protein n=1 Tax=unclassified Micromonospora TaxID=2617518 RepID=UPI003624C19B